MARLRAGNGVLHHQAFIGGYAQELRSCEKDLRVRLTAADLVPIRHGVKITAQPQPLQDEEGILAGGADAQLQPAPAQGLQGIEHLLRQVGGTHARQQAAVGAIFFFRQLLFASIAQRRPLVPLQDDLQALHAAHAP